MRWTGGRRSTWRGSGSRWGSPILLRNLPRTRGESSVLAGAMVATAFAVSVYGLYQVGVELPALQAQFARNPLPSWRPRGSPRTRPRRRSSRTD